MRRIIGNIVSVTYSFIKLSIMKLFHFKRLKFCCIERLSPNVVIEINKKGKLTLGKCLRVHSGSKIKVRNNAEIKIGNNVKINYNCIFVAKECISIGEGTEFGPGVLIYDHDHDYRSGLKKERFLTTPVAIGKNCWIGANTIILRGSVIGDNCVVGAGSIVKGNVPANSVFIQKKNGNE